jgi:hypothetical protein
MGFLNSREVEMLCNAHASGLAKPPRENPVCKQTVDRRRQGLRIARWYEQACLAFDDELGNAADLGRDDRQAGLHGFENRKGKAFGASGEDEDRGGAEERPNVTPLSEQSDRRVDSPPPYFILYRGSLRPVTDEEGLEVPSAKHRKRTHERERVLGRLQAPNHYEPGAPLQLGNRTSASRIDAVADDYCGRLTTGARVEPSPAFSLRNTDRYGRQRAKSALDPSVRSRGQPAMGEKRPPVDGVHANGHSCEPPCNTPERRRFGAVDVNDLGPFASQEPNQLHQTKDVTPRADGTADSHERQETCAGRSRLVAQGTFTVGRDEDVEIVDESREQRGNICLRASPLCQRDEENNSRPHGRLIPA